ncbi:MAG: hypothetical protein JRI25_18530 [Deltaproteobacteria bacterium]|nr:hypothetical protein [Deltaproteobacteria bacterium]
MIPFPAGNSTDGLGFGIAADVWRRPVAWTHGYDLKIRPYAWTTINGNRQSISVQVERRGVWDLAGRIGFRRQSNLPYAGSGGGDVVFPWGDVELGNQTLGLSGFATVSRQLNTSPWFLYLQAYVRWMDVAPGEGALLAQREPLAEEGGTYFDVSAGLFVDHTDQWPVPTAGYMGEVDLRVGATLANGTVSPLAGLHGELVYWWSLGSPRWVVGARALVEHSLGERPFFEQDVTGGRLRDDLGSDQALSGYGPGRTRGDGVVAVMVELRPELVSFAKDNVKILLSLYAEEAFLFRAWDPGPHMPSVGVAPMGVFWRGAQLRPFIAWGWRRKEHEDDRRVALPQVGISFVDPL